MGLAPCRSGDGQPYLDHLSTAPYTAFVLLLFSWFSTFGHISATFHPVFSLSCPSQGVFADPSVPPLQLSSQSQTLDTHYFNIKVVGMPVGTDAYARESATEINQDGGAKQLVRMLPRMLDEQPTNLVTTGPMAQRTTHTLNAWWIQNCLRLHAERQMATPHGCLRNCLISGGRAAEESSFFENDCPTNRLALQPYPHAKTSTGA